MPNYIDANCYASTSDSLVSIEQFGLGDARIKEFAALPWRLYRNDGCWTPPLTADYLGNRLLGAKGLLTAEHPYHESAEVTHFLARREGRIVGRISAAINRRFNEYHNTRLGFFGFFEVEEDYEAAAALLDAAKEWIAAKGMTAMRGPGEYSNATHERQGVLIDGFEHPPTVELTHNPPYYADLLDRYGLTKAKDYNAYLMEVVDIPLRRLERVAANLRRRVNIRTRCVDLDKFTEDIHLIVQIYNEAWSGNWGFLPMTDIELAAIAESMRHIADPGLMRFAYIDDEPAGVLGIIPDPNWLLRPLWRWYGDSDLVRITRLLTQRRNIPMLRFMFFGILPKYRRMGIDALLISEAIVYGSPLGYQRGEGSLILEDNEQVISVMESLGGRRYKTWRIYEMPVN